MGSRYQGGVGTLGICGRFALAEARTVDNGYNELAICGEHAIGLSTLPPIHKDPFDRMLIAQAIAEEIVLMTTDAKITRYPAPVRAV
ncbi:type II toxin-antitoxin system VapC family toxin [Nitratireductor sp. XY-223]|uniref:type II toxin-antitoxin system VapC family toxin n=1 Tax=Nitratireductor sp. XY-223 TaxID=2561926 RepID=UPI0032B2F308